MENIKVDIHTHILPPDLPRFREKYGYGGFMTLERSPSCRSGRLLWDDGRFFREVSDNLWDPDARIRDCDRFGVKVQVLSTMPSMFNYGIKPQDGLDLSKYLNDHLAEVASTHPSRFIGLGTLPLQAPELAIRELERCLGELKFAGAQIGSHVNAWNFDDERLFPFFEAAAELGAALFVHPWDMMGAERMPKYWLPWLVGMPAEVSLAICSLIFGGVFERLPELRIAFAHGGGAFPGTLGRIEQGFRARPDLCAVDNRKAPRNYLNRIYVDSHVHDPVTLRYLVEVLGADRIALGSDYPFPLGEEEPGKLIESTFGLNVEVRDRLFCGTALEWLGPGVKIDGR